MPVFSANVRKPMGYMATSNLHDFTRASVLCGIDGNFEFSVIQANKKFATTDHCGTIRILSDLILPEYLLFALDAQRRKETFDRSFRASLANMRRFQIKVPVTPSGEFDLEVQRLVAERFSEAQDKCESLATAKVQLDESYKRYVANMAI